MDVFNAATACTRRGSSRQNRPEVMQHFLKQRARAAGAEVVAAEFLAEVFEPGGGLYAARALLDLLLGGEAPPSFTDGRESSRCRRRAVVDGSRAWWPPCGW